MNEQVDAVLVNKAATIERCVARAREEYEKDPSSFEQDFTRQDAAILNIQRACEASLDMGQRIIRLRKLGIAQSSRDVYTVLEQAKVIDPQLADTLKRMTGFRNIAVHDYQTLAMPIVIAVITKHLNDFLAFSEQLLKAE